MLNLEVKNYISKSKGQPFFYVVGDLEYSNVLNDLLNLGLSLIRMSDFCNKDDKFPSIDDLVDYLHTSDIDFRDNKVVIVGVGEYLALKGPEVAKKEIRRLKDTTIGNTRAIILLRGIAEIAKKMISEDKRILEKQRAYVDERTSTSISLTVIRSSSYMSQYNGIKQIIHAFEDGADRNISGNTCLLLDQSIIPVKTIDNSFELIRTVDKSFNLNGKLGDEKHWEHLLKDIIECDNRLIKVFEKYGIDDDLIDNLHDSISGYEYRNWVVFIYLKVNNKQFKNSYFKYVIDKTNNYEELKTNLIIGIVDFVHTDSLFMEMYNDRKKLIKNFPDEDIAVFLKANEYDSAESIYRFTDNTILEKKAVIKWISKNGLSDAISYVYPALYDYLSKYNFECGDLSNDLTEYFDNYKKLKVTNRITAEFMELVNKHGSEISYAQLQTRDNAIKGINNKKDSYLYWIDALGVEYLSYFISLAKRNGLAIKINIARSDLPTITSINKSFFEDWSGDKYKEEELDNIKHKDKGGFYFTSDTDPIHIPSELAVIEKAVRTAKTHLAMHKCKSFVIASDHGASRLAVIKKEEVPHDTDTKGEHSGRCCKVFDGCKLNNVIEENGYLVLTDYGRFRGSRSANVEVHGGASLEEILVPIITLSLKNNTIISIKVLHPNEIILDRHNGVTLYLYISDVESISDVKIIVNDQGYLGKAEDNTHFTFVMDGIKRAKTYTGDVYDGANLIGNITFTVKGKTAKINDAFDF